MRTIARLLLATTAGRIIFAIIVILGIIGWIYTQVEESRQGDKLRENDRNKKDSIWNDQMTSCFEK